MTLGPQDDAERKACTTISPSGFQLRPPPPPHELHASITPDTHLFQTIHMGAAVVDRSIYRLIITGLVSHNLSLSFDDLLQFPSVDITSFHECYGSPLTPPTTPLWRVGNVVWTGVRLRDLLRLAQPKPSHPHDDLSGYYLWSDGLDYGSFDSKPLDRYQKDLPLSKAMSPEVLVAYAMNGETLTKERGGPVRLIVPGWFGTNSTKWLCRLTLQKTRSPSPFCTTWYNEVDPTSPKGGMRPVWRVEPNSLIFKPPLGEVLKVPQGKEVEVEIQGWTWSCDGVAKVEVGICAAKLEVGIDTDHDTRWIDAVVEARKQFEWQRFRTVVHLSSSGKLCLMARATSADGVQQPLVGRRNCVHTVEVTVDLESTEEPSRLDSNEERLLYMF